MVDSSPHPQPEIGPPVLLKRLGNLVEANLARAKLESAGIPSFLGEQDVFSGGSINAGSRHGVEIYVPAELLEEAFEVLETPTESDFSSPFSYEPFVEDPGRKLSFKSVVTAVIGWLVIVMHPVGAFLAIALFAYAIYLSYVAIRVAFDRDLTLRLRVVIALLVSFSGIAVSATLLAGVFGKP